MNAALDILRSLMGPAVTAGLVSLVLLRVVPGAGARRIAASAGFGLGFCAGYALLEPSNWKPVSNWHWLPWMGMLAMVFGPIAALPRLPVFVRWVLWLLVALVAAWFLVPSWEKLRPVRELLIVGFAGTVFCLTLFHDMLARRSSPAILAFGWSMSAAAGAVLLAAFVSLRFGLLACAAAAGFGGTWIVLLRYSDRDSVRGAGLGHAVVFGGLMLAGLLSNVLPAICFVLILCAPLALWVAEIPGLSKVQGRWGIALRLAAISLPLFAAGIVATV